MNSRPASKTVVTLAVVGSLVLLNIIGVRAFRRFDLTSEKTYTLSQASRETMAALEEQVTVSAYFTENLPPPYASNARYVRDLLEEYRAASKGKLSFEFIDPMSQETDKDKEVKKEVRHDIFGRSFREQTAVEKELAGLGIQSVEIRVVQLTRRSARQLARALDDRRFKETCGLQDLARISQGGQELEDEIKFGQTVHGSMHPNAFPDVQARS